MPPWRSSSVNWAVAIGLGLLFLFTMLGLAATPSLSDLLLLTGGVGKSQKVLPIRLPLAGHTRAMRQRSSDIVITVTARGKRFLSDGQKHFNQAPVGRGELLQYLRGVAEKNADTPIHLAIDRRAVYLDVMDIIDSLELYGLRTVYLRSASPGRKPEGDGDPLPLESPGRGHSLWD